MAKITEKAIVEGYGPANLIYLVKHSPWVRADKYSKNFNGIDFYGSALTIPEDAYHSIKYRLILAAVPQGDSFTVEGYHSYDILDVVRQKNPIIFANKISLGDDPYAEGGTLLAYRLTIEIIS